MYWQYQDGKRRWRFEPWVQWFARRISGKCRHGRGSVLRSSFCCSKWSRFQLWVHHNRDIFPHGAGRKVLPPGWVRSLVWPLNDQYLVVFLANWLSLVSEILASKSFSTDETSHATGMVRLFSGFNTIPLDWLLADAASFHDFLQSKDSGHFRFRSWVLLASGYLIVLGAIGFSVALEEFSVDFPFANATFEALLVVNLSKGGAALDGNRFHAHATFSYKKHEIRKIRENLENPTTDLKAYRSSSQRFSSSGCRFSPGSPDRWYPDQRNWCGYNSWIADWRRWTWDFIITINTEIIRENPDLFTGCNRRRARCDRETCAWWTSWRWYGRRRLELSLLCFPF